MSELRPFGAVEWSPSPIAPSRVRVEAVVGDALLVTGAVFIIGLLDASSARVVELERFVAPGIVASPAGARWLVAVALLLLGRGLRGRRSAALVVTLGGAVAIVLSLVPNEPWHAVPAAVVAALLATNRAAFVVPPASGRLRRLRRPAAALAGVGVVASALLVVSQGRAGSASGWAAAGTTVASRAAGGVGSVVNPTPPISLLLVAVTVTAGVIGWYAAVVALGPADDLRPPDDAASRLAVRQLIAAHGNDSLDPFALRADKRHVVAPDGAAVMSYRCVLGVGLASGDPIGARDARPAAVAAHLAQCDAAGWRPAVLAAGEESLPMYRAFGLRAMYVGDEALIDVGAFALGGGRMRNVRQAVSRSRNFGVTTTHHRQAELDAELRTQLIAVADEWRHGAPEMGFSMALDTLLSAGPEDGDAVIVVARDANGLPIGFQRYLPCRGGHGLSADAMRRAADAPNGITERMIVDTIRWAAEHGVGQVSLNFAAFRRLLDQPGLSMGRATLVVFDRLLPFVRIISLARFNAKFHPRWVPRYLVYRSPLDLPAIGLAALSAEGFLPFDRQRLGQRELGRAG